MDKQQSTRRFAGILIFVLGILLGTGLAGINVWESVEADSYGFTRLSNEHLDGLTCPHLLTRSEIGTIRLAVNNFTKQKINPIIRIDMSTPSVPSSERIQLSIEPGQTEHLKRTVSAENIDLHYFIFVQVYRYPTYGVSLAQASCGILVLDTPLIGGGVLYALWFAASLIGIIAGLWLWETSLTRDEQITMFQVRALRAWAIIVLGVILISFTPVIIFGLLAMVVAVLSTIVIPTYLLTLR